MILKFPDSLGSSHCEVTCTGRSLIATASLSFPSAKYAFPFCWLNLSASGDSMPNLVPNLVPNLRLFQALLVECGGHKHFYMVLKWHEDLTWDCYMYTSTWRSKALFAVSAWRRKSWVGEL